MQRQYTEYAYSLGSLKSFEGHQVAKRDMALASDIADSILDAEKWLPFAAESYNISANIKDYILSPVVIMPSDFPNRNGIGFPFQELTFFNPEPGCLGYKTWKGKPTHVEHANSDYRAAKGIILDSSLRKMTNTVGEVWKVVVLSAWDRNKDSILANAILTGERPAYSMGAMCGDYRCSVCGSLHSKGGCDHAKLGKPEYKVVGNKLAYLEALDIVGFELSSVADPAYTSAVTEKDSLFSWG